MDELIPFELKGFQHLGIYTYIQLHIHIHLAITPGHAFLVQKCSSLFFWGGQVVWALGKSMRCFMGPIGFNKRPINGPILV